MSEVNDVVGTFPGSASSSFWGIGFFRWLVFQSLSALRVGTLTMHLPDGKKAIFGREVPGAKNVQIRILSDGFFKRCVFFGDLGFCESYLDGEWETEDLEGVVRYFISNLESVPTLTGSEHASTWVNSLGSLNRWVHRMRSNTRRGSKINIQEHYDLSNELFALFLDPSMTYSAALFESPKQSLEDAQQAKIRRLLQKLEIRPSDELLEIGSGWGGLSLCAAQEFGCRVKTVTISQQQYDFVRSKVQGLGLQNRIQIELRDYRELEGQFDKIVSVEMLEAVGHEHLEGYFRKCHSLLKKDGLLGLQVILSPDSRYESMRKNVDFIQKHIFPGSQLPSVARINQAINRVSDLSLHDFKDMGLHYAKTLRIWRDQFNARLEQVRSLGFDERFIRKWNLYFDYCGAAFATRNITVAQMIYTRPNNRRLMGPNHEVVHE